MRKKVNKVGKVASRKGGPLPFGNRAERAEAGEVPEWLKSLGRNSAGGGSDQRKSYDVQETSMVNKDKGDES